MKATEPVQPDTQPDTAAMFPLSFAQERLWVVDRISGGGAAYNVSAAVRLFGRLDVPALARAIDDVVRRHEALRTTIAQTRDGLRQIVAAEGRLPLTILDLAASAPSDREAEARRCLRSEARRGFDLATGPLARWTVLRLGPEEHIVQLVAHHVVCDAWSLAIIIREVGQLYDACGAGTPPLETLPLQYADYAVWQRRRAGSAEWTRQREYWRRQLAGATVLRLPADRPLAAEPTAAAQVRFSIDGDATTALRSFAAETGATLFMTLLAGFKALLAGYTAQTDIAVGTPVVDRPRPELEPLVGLFLNTVVLRTDLSGRPSFRELVLRVREVALQAFANQELPFEQVVDELHPSRDTGRNPLFEVLFTLQNAPHEHLRFGGLTSRREETSTDTAKFDLTLLLYEHGEGLTGTVEYRCDVFEASTIEGLVRRYCRLLTAGARNPDRRIGSLAVLEDDEAAEVLNVWNRTDRSAAASSTVHERFERSARDRPHQRAIVCEDARLTYREMEERANRLARYLRSRGIGPEAKVGICLERLSTLPVAVLGALKAGAAYVPLDPLYPDERLRYMVADSGASVVLTSAALLPRLGASPGGHAIVCVDREAAAIARESSARPGPAALPLNIAYVVYTSGSTGRPKGVALSHEALSNLIDWYGAEMHAGPALQFASLGFDASFIEMFGPWSAGSPVYLPPESTRSDPDALVRYVARHGIEKLFLPVVILQRIAETLEGREALFGGVREIVTAGEQMRITPAVARLMERLPACVLHNYYGPSETHNASALRLEGPPASWDRMPPIGYPIWNTRWYVLNGEMQPVPRGAAGELYIAGAGLARGYWNRPDLTAERFAPDPFRGDGGRLYRTGDLVRRLPGGAIQFIGRSDRQVKVRGCRIEPREIEAVLLEDAAIREAAVTVDGGSDDPRLVAYVVPRYPPGPTPGAIRGRLRVRLPEYMVPSAFVLLDALPLNQNGKVDHAALPAAPREPAGALAPRGAVEALIASAWAEVLRRDEVGVEDNLFDLGAHSLSVAQMTNRLSHWFGIDIPVSSVFRGPTVAALAELVSARLGGDLARDIADDLLRTSAARQP